MVLVAHLASVQILIQEQLQIWVLLNKPSVAVAQEMLLKVGVAFILVVQELVDLEKVKVFIMQLLVEVVLDLILLELVNVMVLQELVMGEFVEALLPRKKRFRGAPPV